MFILPYIAKLEHRKQFGKLLQHASSGKYNNKKETVYLDPVIFDNTISIWNLHCQVA